MNWVQCTRWSLSSQASWQSRAMDKLSNQQVLDAGLADWRKLAHPWPLVSGH